MIYLVKIPYSAMLTKFIFQLGGNAKALAFFRSQNCSTKDAQVCCHFSIIFLICLHLTFSRKYCSSPVHEHCFGLVQKNSLESVDHQVTPPCIFCNLPRYGSFPLRGFVVSVVDPDLVGSETLSRIRIRIQ
jgi:hypothetical protein